MGKVINAFFHRCSHGLTPIRRQVVKACLAAIAVAALSGCAIHPVQQDVTGIPPKLLVDRIRCEARLAVFDKAVNVLHQTAEQLRGSDPAMAEKFDAVVRNLQSRRGDVLVFDARELPTARARAFYSRYINTVIAYDFLTQGVEDNKVALAADPVRLITGGSAGIVFGGSSELMRDNQRHYSLADTFSELLYSRTLKCESTDYLPENFIYPIAGSVGLREVIDTFIELNEDKPLSELDKDAKTVFADTLKFTTTLTGAAAPHVQIDPVGSQFGLAAPTNIGLSASRADTHTLTVGLAMGPPQALPMIGAPFALRPRLTGANRVQQSNKDAAFQAIQELRYRSFLDRVGTINLR
jgi:hypothetical protein